MSNNSDSSQKETEQERLCQAVQNAETYFQNNNDGPQPDSTAVATIQQGLVCKITCPENPNRDPIYTDMPEGIGGTGKYNSPGWHFRSALASCDATMLAIRAARTGIQFDTIQVKAESSSDGRGMLLDTTEISPGCTDMKLTFIVSSQTATKEQIHDLVRWVEKHSPVGTDVMSPIKVTTEIQIL